DFIAVSSYNNGQHSSGEVRLTKDLDESIEGLNVLLVEDILDTGLTMNYLVKLLQARAPKSFRVAVLCDKPSRREQPFTADYVGFTVPNEYLVGYGMDCNEQYRNLPGIHILVE